MPHGKLGRLGACLVLLSLLGCGDGLSTPTPESAEIESAPTCAMVDLTKPDVARRLEGATRTQLGDEMVRYEGGRKISSVQILADVGKAAQSVGDGPSKSLKVTIKCTSICAGNFCTSSGCSASSFGCSTHSC